MIDRQMILQQMEGLAAQRRQHEDNIKAVDGAMQMCRHWLAECDRQDEAAAAKARAEAEALAVERNGQPADGVPVEN